MILIRLFVAIVVISTTASAQEPHLKNIRQLTFGGDNAEAYFSPDGKYLSFQSNNPAWGLKCDQIFVMNIDSAANNPNYKPRRISTGKGRTTCAYFMPDGKHVLYASTHEGGDECPPAPAPRADHKYLWSIYDTYDIYVADLQGNIVKKLTNSPGYDAEATVSPKGDKIVFTSTRSGDVELWTMNLDGTGLYQVTSELGYDGGAFFTPDGNKLIYRASQPPTDSAMAEYQDLIKQGLVAPTEMELFMCDLDGTQLVQLTHLGKANWAPFMRSDGKTILFSSNHASSRGYDFQLYRITLDNPKPVAITTESNFNAFPIFSPDGKRLVWSSNRNNGGTHDTNVFIADWVDTP